MSNALTRIPLWHCLMAVVFMLPGTATLPTAVLAGSNDHAGFVKRLGADLLSGNDGNTVRLQLTLGYQYTERFSAGIGTGYTFYHDPVDLIPVYLELAYLLGSGNTVPFLHLKAGRTYSRYRRSDLPWTGRHDGGLMINPGLGIRFRGSGDADFYLLAGFNADHTTHELETFPGRIVRDDISFRRFSFGFGFIF